MLKKKKLIVCGALLLTIGVGATFAYLQQRSNELTNTFKVADVDTEIDEPDMEPDGSNIKKEPSVKNIGKTDAIIRVRCVVSPEDMLTKDEINYNDELNDISAVDPDIEGNWINGGDGYWYYQAVIPAGKETEPLFTEIKGVIVSNSDGTYSFAEGYDDFEITVYQEAVQATVTKSDGTVLSALDQNGNYNQTNAKEIWNLAEQN